MIKEISVKISSIISTDLILNCLLPGRPNNIFPIITVNDDETNESNELKKCNFRGCKHRRYHTYKKCFKHWLEEN